MDHFGDPPLKYVSHETMAGERSDEVLLQFILCTDGGAPNHSHNPTNRSTAEEMSL
jgi:hypothetical protein